MAMQILGNAHPFDYVSNLESYFSNDFLEGRTEWMDLSGAAMVSVTMTEASVLQDSTPELYGGDADHIDPSFSEQYVDAVHISITQVDLGNLLSEQVFDVEIWNNHRHEVVLNNIDEYNTVGIDFVGPIATPTIYKINEYRMYTLTISTVGPPVIDGVFTLNFVDYTMSISVTGKRVVVWPFIPQVDFTETINFSTEIIQTKQGEQRIANRLTPRVSYSGRYILDSNEFSRIKAIMYQWGFRAFGLPMWLECQYYGSVTTGQTVFYVDTTESTYRVGDMLILHEENDKYETLEILSITDTEIETTLPASQDYSSAFIMPVLFSYTDGIDVTRDVNGYPIAETTFTSTEGIDIAADTGKTQYNGKDVMLDRSIIIGSLKEKLYTDVTKLDAEVGPILYVPTKEYPEHKQTMSMISIDRSSTWAYKQWLYSLKGKQKSFYIPTWNQDIEIIGDLEAAQTSLVCKFIGYSLYYDTKDLLIEDVYGNIRIYTITGGTDLGDGTEALYLYQKLGVDLPNSEIKTVCFLSLVRLDADRIEISHKPGGSARISIPIREVPA
jgi:hypothetical protein